jgi:hypothetical protein
VQETGEDLVLGIVQGYTWSHIEPFIVSLHATGYAGHVCLMYRDMTAEALTSLEAAGIELVPFRLASVPAPGRRRTVTNILLKLHRSRLGKYALLPRVNRAGIELAARWSRDPQRTKARIIQSVLSIYMVRFSVWYLYLTSHRAHFKRVMLTDVRDVLFQRDPFEFPFDGTLCVFLEDGSTTIGTDWHTGPLVRNKYGLDALQEIESRPIACAGVTIGSIDSILHYLRGMIDESTGLVDTLNQGIHNVLLYRGAFDPIRVFRNDEGPVLTLGRVPPDALRFDDDGWLVNKHGTVPNVVHQYDRHLGQNGIRLERTENTIRLVRPSASHHSF